MKQKSNMYSSSVAQFNPYAGCRFDCSYCRPSFQAQAKRQKQRCMKCYTYEPHEHPERLDRPLPRTKPGEFIFVCASGDISFCSTEYLEKIVDRIRREPDKTFLMQSKDPRTFLRMESWPRNVVLGTTIETSDDLLVNPISKAPMPVARFHNLCHIIHPRKMLTIEPIMEFHIETLSRWAIELRPELVWIGYDSRKTGLPEPELAKVMELRNRIQAAGIPVHLKRMRERMG